MRQAFEYLKHLNLTKKENHIYLPINNKIFIYSLNLEKENEIVNEDEILNFHLLNNNQIVLIGKINKKITLLNEKFEKVSECTHIKKVTSSILVEEDKINYLIISDKFGEIYIKNLNIDFSENPIIIYGHSDPIHMMKMSPFNNIIISADTFGKIKVCEFPNIFNFLSVFLYKNEDIKYCDFVSNKELLVLNSEHKINFWSLEDYELKSTQDLTKILENEKEIISLIPFRQNLIYLETENFYFVLEKEENYNLVKLEQIEKKKENVDKSFLLDLENNYKIIAIDNEGNIKNIEERNI